MGIVVQTFPFDPYNPTVAEWDTFMKAIATAPSGAIISLSLQGAALSDPTVADVKIPVEWIKVSPRFDVVPPVVTPPTPPAPTYELFYVTSTTGLKVRKTPSVAGEQIGSLAYRAQAMVTGSTEVTEKDATGATVTYHWGALQSGGYVAREFLSKTQPPL